MLFFISRVQMKARAVSYNRHSQGDDLIERKILQLQSESDVSENSETDASKSIIGQLTLVICKGSIPGPPPPP